MKRLFPLCLLLFAASFSEAQTTADKHASAVKEFRKTDQQLFRVYHELLQLLEPKEAALLQKAQKSWIAFRTAHCQYSRSIYTGGVVQPVVYYSCLQDITQQRINQLKVEIDQINSR